MSGTQTEVRYSSTEEIQEADVHIAPATYLYSDGDMFHFMNDQTYEEVAISHDILGDGTYYLQEQMKVEVTFYNGQTIGVNLPQTVILTITETEPELRGATASNSPKPAKTNTGLTLTVPAFIKQGERVIVSTTEGKYLSRAD